MHLSTTLTTLFASLSLASPGITAGGHGRTHVQAGGDADGGVPADIYEAIHQSEYTLALTLDTKDWGRLGESVTPDLVYDSRPLGPDYGILAVGLEQFIEKTKAAVGHAYTAHHVDNAVIKLNANATEANVTTYIVYTRWDPKALYDPKKTYRIYERADSVFVLEDETWKMKYSLITNLAPKVESPYFGNDVGNVRNGSHHYYY